MPSSGASSGIVSPAWDDSAGPQPLGFGPDAEPIVLDWFGRGEPDLLVTARGGPAGRRARVYRPVSSPGESPPRFDEGVEVPALDGLRLPCAIPNGQESRFDLVAIGGGGLVWLKNSGTAHEPRFGDRVVLDLPADLGLGNARVAQMLPIDWDGDGRVDLVFGVDDLDGYWPDPKVPTNQQVGLDETGSHPGFDRSGRWQGRSPVGRLFWARNLGPAEGPLRFDAPEPIDPNGPLAEVGPRPAGLLVAWGTSAAVEVASVDEEGTLRFFRNFGGQLPPVLMEPRPLMLEDGQPFRFPEDRTVVSAADLDRDRRSELVFGTSEGRVFAVHSGSRRDSGRMVGPVLQEGRTLRLPGGAAVTAGDLDGDGGLDLVSGDASGQLHWLMDLGGPGDHRYGPLEPVEAGGIPFRIGPGTEGRLLGPIEPPMGSSSPVLVDWKDNGRPDLIVTGRGGDVLFLRNNGHATQPRFDHAEPIRCERRPLILPSRVQPAAIDWCGSGLPDLIAPDFQGFLSVWKRVDTLDVAPPEPLVDRYGRLIRVDGAFGLGGRCSLWAGPWTESDRPDLLLGLPLDARFVVPGMTGLSYRSLDEAPNLLLLENRGDGVVIPRPLHLADGRPLVAGDEGVSPIGVDWSGRGSLDLLLGSSDGSVQVIPRELLRW
ncbi:hypothetical protein AB1L88_06430 [Tautonia sp. JC769]|uniref:hypothetical protein n=1 Tax=Tautonia sp. JC769 TaxID=3232135 RepID=UPI00345A789F